MKGRESGMPDAEYWETFFDASEIVKRFIPKELTGTVVEFGSGYGTFTLPLARIHPGPVIGLDIEADLVTQVQEQAQTEGLTNIRVALRDFILNGTGEPDHSVAHAMLYNILHIENPQTLLAETLRILQPGGSLSIIHWRSDIPTPRGPSLAIRPTPEQCIQWARNIGFAEPRMIDLAEAAPYHYGIVLLKPSIQET